MFTATARLLSQLRVCRLGSSIPQFSVAYSAQLFRLLCLVQLWQLRKTTVSGVLLVRRQQCVVSGALLRVATRMVPNTLCVSVLVLGFTVPSQYLCAGTLVGEGIPAAGPRQKVMWQMVHVVFSIVAFVVVFVVKRGRPPTIAILPLSL